MLMWYGPFARLADWYHGIRDGLAEIPDRPPPVPRPSPDIDDGRPAALWATPRWRIATTAHREYLIRMAQDAFEKEHTRYEAGLITADRRLAANRVLREGAEDRLAAVAAELADVSRPLSEDEATRRGLGEARHADPVIRRRRERDRRRRIAAVSKRHDEAHRRCNAAVADVAAAESEARTHRKVARSRVGRIHEHFERRIAAYRRALVRIHPDGAWVNHVIGVLDPTIPGWINNGIQPDYEVDGTGESPVVDPAKPPDPPVEPIPLGAVTSFGSDPPVPGHVHVDYYYAAPRHFELRRRGDALDLVEFGHGYGPFIGGKQVGRARLTDGSTFDFGGYTYRLSISADGVAVLHRLPLGPCHLVVQHMSAKTGSQVRLTDMSVVQRAGTVMAILGPSGAGKTSLFFGLMNELRPEKGSKFYFRDFDVTTHGEQIRTMLGFVPQSDDLHRTLTVRRLLAYSDRLHRRSGRQDREERIRKVCERLRVEDRIDRLVGTLSGGQLKRVSIALELLRQPDLLMLDEPTSGLDAGMDREVMRLLSGYASGEERDGSGARLVIVITHTTTHLNHARQLLVLATGGRPVFAGEPYELLPSLGTGSYADVMDMLTGTDGGSIQTVNGLAAAYQRGPMVALAEVEARKAAAKASTSNKPVALRAWHASRRFYRQLPILVQRQVHLLLARGSSKNRRDRRLKDMITTPIKAALPLLIALGGAAIAAVVAKEDGLSGGHSVLGTLGLLTTLSMLAGQSLTYADIVSEFPIIRRERRTGAVTAAVVVSKWLVFAVLAVLQAALVTAVFVAVKPGPAHSHVLAPTTELFVNLAALTVAAMTLGLLISTLATKVEQAVNWNTFVAIGQIALNGASADLSSSPIGDAFAALLPTRWGLAATASSIDLNSISPTAPHDPVWESTLGRWLADLTWLAALTAVFFAVTLLWLRRRLNRPE